VAHGDEYTRRDGGYAVEPRGHEAHVGEQQAGLEAPDAQAVAFILPVSYPACVKEYGDRGRAVIDLQARPYILQLGSRVSVSLEKNDLGARVIQTYKAKVV
jgi:hypothetical protein